MDKFYKDTGRTEALRIGHDNLVEYLRMAAQVDLKLFFGFMTLQLALAGWLATHPPEKSTSVGILIVDVALAAIAGLLLWNNADRRKATVMSLARFEEALGFTADGAYIEEKPLKERAHVRPWLAYYFSAMFLTIVGVATILPWK